MRSMFESAVTSLPVRWVLRASAECEDETYAKMGMVSKLGSVITAATPTTAPWYLTFFIITGANLIAAILARRCC